MRKFGLGEKVFRIVRVMKQFAQGNVPTVEASFVRRDDRFSPQVSDAPVLRFGANQEHGARCPRRIRSQRLTTCRHVLGADLVACECVKTASRNQGVDSTLFGRIEQRVLRHQFRSNCRVGKRFSQVLHRRRKSLHEKPWVKRLFYADRKDGLLRLAGAE